MTATTTRRRGRWPLRSAAFTAGLLLLPLAACDTEELLEVTDPEFASPESLADSAALPTLLAGAIGDFQVGYSGDGGDGFLSVSALITDEFYSSGSFPTRTVTDQRDQFPVASGNTSDDAFERLQAARRSLNDAAEAISEFAPSDTTRLARARALAGYSIVALAEGFCGNIPFSNAPRGVRGELGEGVSTAAAIDSAVARFNQALAASPSSSLAAIGKGRALLNVGRYQEAAAAVAGVDDSFVYSIEQSSNTGRQNNPIFSLQDNGRYSVSDNEGGNGLPFLTANDPRVPWDGPFPGFVRAIPQFINLRYVSLDSDVPLATGIEARLIEAEAALQAGNIDLWLSKLNALRANVIPLMSLLVDDYQAVLEASEVTARNLAPLTDPGTMQARVDLMFSERAFWLYNTGHRLGDLRRLVRNYGRSANDVFPVGDYFKGGTYGNDVNFPIPFNEVNNEVFNAAQCVTTEA